MRIVFHCTCILAAVCLTQCQAQQPAFTGVDPEQISQVSVINALMVGQYDGVMTVRDLLRRGDFGLGTLDHLDGELIVLDGQPFQIRGGGEIVEVDPARTTPFAVVTRFDAEGFSTCQNVSTLSELDQQLNGSLPQHNNFVAIRVEGRFDSITLRSVHRQEPPYKSLGEVAKSQSVWNRSDVQGTLVGIRSPSWVVGLNVPGYHWHFLSDDHMAGGHVLDCRIRSGQISYDVCHSWKIEIPVTEAFNQANLGEDLSQDLRQVESARHAAGGEATE